MTEHADEIREWMEQGGRPLEMRVAAAFLRSTSDVQQSLYYVDPETEKHRETDVVARYASRAVPNHVVSVEAECKAKMPPLIVLLPGSVRSSTDALLSARCASRHARSILPDRKSITAADLNWLPLFDPHVPLGYSVLTKSKGSDDREDKGWAAAMAAAKAADWFATSLDEWENPESHLAFPAVVTDGVLTTAVMVDGEIEVAEVEHARVLLNRSIGTSPAVIVDFVQERYLPDFVRGCESAARGLLAHMSNATRPHSP